MTDEPELDLEAPENDAYEQRQAVLSEDDENDESAESPSDLSEELARANEADVLEQHTPVRGGDDSYDS